MRRHRRADALTVQALEVTRGGDRTEQGNGTTDEDTVATPRLAWLRDFELFDHYRSLTV